MKKSFIFLFALFVFSSLFAQSKEFKSKNNANNGLTQVESDSIKAQKIFNDSINYQVSLINSHLNSIQIKWDWILNHPEEKAIAEEEKWFEHMTAIRAKLEARKQTLINSLK